MSYYKQHLNKVKNAKILSLNKIERGMVVMLRYKPHDEIVSKPYMLFVLQPKWPNDGNGKLHALSLDNVDPDSFKEFAKDYPEVYATSNKVKKLNLSKLQIDETSRRFYNEEIRNVPAFSGAYRVFDLKRISVLSVVNYDYGKYDRID